MLDRILHASHQDNKLSQSPATSPQLHRTTQAALLLAWRDHLVAQLRTRKHSPLKPSPLEVMAKVHEYRQAGLFPPDLLPYNVILHVLAKQANSLPPHKVDSVLRDALQKIYDPLVESSKENSLLAPNRETIYYMVQLWDKSGRSTACIRVEEYLKELQSRHAQHPTCNSPAHQHNNFQPDAKLYCAIMQVYSGYAQRQQQQPNRRVVDPVKRILQLFQEMKEKAPDLHEIAYNRTCHALAKITTNRLYPHACDAAKQVFDDMCHEHFANQQEHLKPGHFIFGSVLTAYGRAQRADEALQVFEFMQELYVKTGDASFRPNTVCYSAMVWAYAAVGNVLGAEQILLQLVAAMEQGKSKDLVLNTQILAGVLAAWSKSDDSNAPERIRQFINKIQHLDSEQNLVGNLNTTTYNTLLGSYSKSKTLEAAAAAERVFWWMAEQEEQSLAPDRDSCLSVIIANCAAGGHVQASKFVDHVCEGIQQNLLRPELLDQQHFTVLIDAWGTSEDPKSGKKAQEVFQTMQQMGIEPTTLVYSSLVWAWARSRTDDPAKPAEDLFWEMKQLSDEGNESVKPNEVTVFGLLCAFSYSAEPDAMNRADKIFKQMDEFGIEKSRRMYNVLMTGWSRRDSLEKVDFYFDALKQKYEEGANELQPLAKDYLTRLVAWSKTGNVERTTDLLSDMTQQGILQGLCTEAFNAVLQALALSGRDNASEDAENWLLKMHHLSDSKQFNCRPDIDTYNHAIASCASKKYPDGERALKLFNIVIEKGDIDADFYSFAWTLLAVASSGDEASVKMIINLWSERHGDHFWPGPQALWLLMRVEQTIRSSSFESRQELLKTIATLRPS